MNDADFLEIFSYLPSLREWIVDSSSFAITIDGAKEWKRICPNLQSFNIERGEGLSEEVKEVLKGLGVAVE
jgi:hypothetical protein